MFAVGSWLLYVGQENEYDVITGSRSIVSGASLLVLAGGVAIVLSAVGMAGAYGMWRPLLIIVSYISPRPSYCQSGLQKPLHNR